MLSPANQKYRTAEWVWFGTVVLSAIYALFSSRNLPLEAQFKILIVVIATPIGAVFFVKGLLSLFAKRSGWNEALPLFLWSASMLTLGAANLPSRRNQTAGVVMMGFYALFAVAAGVLQQRLRERSQ